MNAFFLLKKIFVGIFHSSEFYYENRFYSHDSNLDFGSLLYFGQGIPNHINDLFTLIVRTFN